MKTLVVIPAYNEALNIEKTVHDLEVNAPDVDYVVVNDGSKDNTVEIANNLKNLTTVGDKSIVRVIDKENGGHGSTINVGIQEARGKYVKIVDGDDTVDSEEFAKLIDILEHDKIGPHVVKP